MAGSKAPRNKKYTSTKRTSVNVSTILNRVLNKWYVIGDMNHDPKSFHTGELNVFLKGRDLVVALQEMAKFFYDRRQEWVFAVYHFFKVDGKIEVVPSVMRIQNTTLNEMADQAEDNIRQLKESVIDVEDDHTEENYIFYGYYLNFGGDIRLDLMEEKIIESLYKVNNDLESIRPEIVPCTAEKVLRSIVGDKFVLSNPKALSTSMTEENYNET